MSIPSADATGPPRIAPSTGCGCGGGRTKADDEPGWIFALGMIGYDLISEARRDSIRHAMGGPDRDPHDPAQMIDYLTNSHIWDAESIHWTLDHDQTPIYVIIPFGTYARETYDFLIETLKEQSAGKRERRVDRVAIAGRLSGRVKLLDGREVPVIIPQRRGMSRWNTGKLLHKIAGENPAKRDAVNGFLERAYHDLRNPGATAEERAINYAATEAATVGGVFEKVLESPERMELDSIDVERSKTGRPDSDCWDVKLHFFYPARQVQTVRMLYQFTVDVSDVVPVVVGPTRSWSVR